MRHISPLEWSSLKTKTPGCGGAPPRVINPPERVSPHGSAETDARDSGRRGEAEHRANADRMPDPKGQPGRPNPAPAPGGPVGMLPRCQPSDHPMTALPPPGREGPGAISPWMAPGVPQASAPATGRHRP